MFLKMIEVFSHKMTMPKNNINWERVKDLTILVGGLALFVGIWGFAIYSLFTTYSSKASGHKENTEILIIGTEPDLQEVIQYLEANEERFLPLFPSFEREKNVIKLCQVDNWREDIYFIKDDTGVEYRIGYGRNWNFHYDTLNLNPKIDNSEPLLVRERPDYDECIKLNL